MTEHLHTYTYTARSLDNPDNIVTFTLDDNHMRVNLTGVLEKLEKVIESDEKPTELRHQFVSQFQPGALKAAEIISAPVHLSDVSVDLDDGRLKVNTWKRVAGLRLAPIGIKVNKVDNPDAAQAFVREFEERRTASERIGKFIGPLDYWFGWLAMILAVMILFRWPNREGD
jgi:hypothetical protein